MNWKLCVTDPQKRALDFCRGSMDEGDGFGAGYCFNTRGSGYGYGDDYGNGYGYGDGSGNGGGYGDGDGYGYGYGNGDSDGFSPPEWK